MRNVRTRSVVAGLGAAALLIPSAAVAAPGGASAKADGVAKSGKRVKSKKPKTVMYVAKGVFDEAGNVDVKGGNKHTKRAGLVRDDVQFDLTRAKLVVADTNGDEQVTLADIKAGDKVVVQLKLPRALGDAPLVARKVVDQTNPPVDETEAPAPVAADA